MIFLPLLVSLHFCVKIKLMEIWVSTYHLWFFVIEGDWGWFLNKTEDEKQMLLTLSLEKQKQLKNNFVNHKNTIEKICKNIDIVHSMWRFFSTRGEWQNFPYFMPSFSSFAEVKRKRFFQKNVLILLLFENLEIIIGPSSSRQQLIHPKPTTCPNQIFRSLPIQNYFSLCRLKNTVRKNTTFARHWIYTYILDIQSSNLTIK